MTAQIVMEFPTAESVCELVLGDPAHERERAAVIDAIRSYANSHAGLVDVNGVRPTIPSWVAPQVVSATYNALITRHILEWTREWTTSTDTKGRNVGKPQRIYRWLGDPLMTTSESPTVFAKRLGIVDRMNMTGRGSSMALSWDNVLDLAVKAYWRRRAES